MKYLNQKYNLWHLLEIAVTVLALAAGVVCWVVSYLPPMEGNLWGLVTLATPVVLVVNGVLCVYWLWKKRWMCFGLPFLALFINEGYIFSMVQLRLPSREVCDLRVATLNADTFSELGREPKNHREMIEVVKNLIERENIDICALQEFTTYNKVPTDSMAQMFLERFPYVAYDEGLAIVSLHPILSHEYRRFPDSGNDFMRASVLFDGDTIQIYAAHLQTTGISNLRWKYKEDDLSEIPLKEVAKSLEENNRKRAMQVWEMRQKVDSVGGRAIVMGDFNDPPSSYTYRYMKGNLRDGFRVAGNGFGATFRGIRGLMRIDYIFYDRAYECVRYRTLSDRVSDHRMVVADLKID